jgi:hypothetical protein
MWAKCFEDTFSNTANDTYSVTKYNVKTVNIEVSSIFINSKLNHYQRKLGETEHTTEEIKTTIQIMDSSLNNLQKLFPKVFLNSPQKSDEVQRINDVSEQIEQVVLNLVGKNIILWEKFLHITNKCLLVACLFMMIMFRADLLTLIICSILLAVEYLIVNKTHYNLLMKGLVCSIIFDVIWSIYYIYHYRSMSLLEGDYSGTTYRKFTTILSGFVILMKLILLIAIWRLTQLQKYNDMNPESKKIRAEVKEEPIFVHTTKTKVVEKTKTFQRPTIRRDKTQQEGNVGLRDTDVIDKV